MLHVFQWTKSYFIFAIIIVAESCPPSKIFFYLICRHQIELQVKDVAKDIETVKKDLEIQMKKVRVIENNLEKSQEELEQYQVRTCTHAFIQNYQINASFQRLKQQKLNRVISTAIMKMHQLQHITPEFTTANISGCLLFSKTKLSKLYKRVEELQNDTLEQKNKHK